jgi:hypothetical protein
VALWCYGGLARAVSGLQCFDMICVHGWCMRVVRYAVPCCALLLWMCGEVLGDTVL